MLTTSAAALVGAILCATPAEAAPKKVRLYVQGVPTNLQTLEDVGKTPVYARDFEIDYDALEPAIDKAIDDVVPWSKTGTIDCTGDCPDLHWKITLNPKFEFTKKNQPKITAVGPSGQATVQVSLESAARFELRAHVWAKTSLDSTDFVLELYTNVNLDAKAKVKLWPKLEVEDLDIELIKGDSNVEYDLTGKMVALGAKWGSIIGSSPGAAALGGPLAFGSLMALFGGVIADAAEDKVDAYIATQIDSSFEKANSQIDALAAKHLDANIAKANDLKSKLMDTDIPGVGQSVADLATKFGASVEVHTVTPSGNLYASGVLRLDPKPGAGELHGELRFPSQSCVVISVGGKTTMIGLPHIDPNPELAAKIGSSCATVVGGRDGTGVGVNGNAWLGANPQKVLGATAQSRWSWKKTGETTYVGTLAKKDDAYVCKFEMSKLPNAAILELGVLEGSVAGKLLHGATPKRRLTTVTSAGKTVAFDWSYKPIAADGSGHPLIAFGGPMACEGGDHDYQLPTLAPSKAKQLLDLIDPEKCPGCGIERVGTTQVYEVTNLQKFLGTPIGKEIDGVMKGAGQQQGQ